MASNSKNLLRMVRDPFAGDSFILPDTLCTEQRKVFFRRAKGIIKFLTISFLKFGFSDGRSTTMQVNSFLNGCDELSQIRHRIIHASSMLDNGKPIFINVQMFQAYFSYLALLTEYVDKLFSDKIRYTQVKINPAEA